MNNAIVNLSFQFALDIIAFTEKLEQDRKFYLANQLFRSGTSIGACIREAQGSESRADFLHKCKIAYKESEESKYCWNYAHTLKVIPILKSFLTK